VRHVSKAVAITWRFGVAQKHHRDCHGLDDEFVVKALRYHGLLENGDEDRDFAKECERKGFSKYLYCLVMQAADRNLAEVIMHEYFAGKDWGKIREVAHQILKGLASMHNNDVLHGGKAASVSSSGENNWHQ
jgi:hypothetical protein